MQIESGPAVPGKRAPVSVNFLENGARDIGAIESEVVRLVRERIGPVAALKMVVTIKRLPKTRSGKILRGTMQKIADREEWAMPATIDDPAILDEIAAALSGRQGGT